MHLFNKENIWSNPQQLPAYSNDPAIQTRIIILWTELFPKKRRDSSIYLRVQNTVVFPQIIHILQELQDFFKYSVFYSVSTRDPATPSNSPYRINSSTRNTTTTRLIPCRLPPATVPRVSKHSTQQNKAPGLPYSIPRPYSTSRLPVILPGRNSIPSSRQHPRSPYSTSQASSTVLHYRILPGEIGFFPKGLSIVYPCNTKVSVFQFTYSCLRIIPQEN